MARRFGALGLVLVFLGGLVASAEPSDPSPPKEDYYELFELLVDTVDQVERNYVEEIDRRELIEAAIEGVLGKLDPYSAYIGPQDVSRFRTTVDSEFGGIGIQMTSERGQLTIFSPLVGTPAYDAGLMAGDRIVEIEGQSTEGMRIEDAVHLLKGEAGTKVKMAVARTGARDKIEVTLTRERIHVETVLGDRRKENDAWDFVLLPEEKIGYIRVTGFSQDTLAELRAALGELKTAGIEGLVLDLRFNPGGLLNSAIEVSDLFISDGRIVSTEGRNSPERSWDATKPGTFEGFSMVVLVNRYSASASEIVAACLQDHKRAVVAGERTWGKGSVQNVIELAGGNSLLKLTTAAYRRPSGKNINRFGDDGEQKEWGVSPDDGLALRLNDREMERLLLVRRERDVVRPDSSAADAGTTAEATTINAPDEESATEETPAGESSTDESSTDEAAPEQPASTQPAEEDRPNGSQSGGAFVDRQLQMAVDYLMKEMARAEQETLAGRTPEQPEQAPSTHPE